MIGQWIRKIREQRAQKLEERKLDELAEDAAVDYFWQQSGKRSAGGTVIARDGEARIIQINYPPLRPIRRRWYLVLEGEQPVELKLSEVRKYGVSRRGA